MTHVFFPLAIIAAYLLGSIPFGLLIAKTHGKDLRSIGSGNTGATNVSRALGRKWAYFCFILDVLKGLIPMLATMLIAKPDSVLTLWLSYLPNIRQIQRRQGRRDEFRRGAGSLALLYDLCLVRCRGVGCVRFNLAVCFSGVDRRFGYLSPRFDSGDNSNAGLEAWRFVAGTDHIRCDTGNGHYPPSRKHQKAACGNREQNLTNQKHLKSGEFLSTFPCHTNLLRDYGL